MIQPTHIIRRVSTTDVTSVDDLLQSTVEALIPDVLAMNRGIRVTRTGAGEYTVETAADVGCGYTVYKHRSSIG